MVSNGIVAEAQRNSELDSSTEDNIFLRDLQNHLNSIVNTLPAKCRDVYELSRLKYKTNQEIAEILNISEKTVEGRLTQALKLIKAGVGEMLLVYLFLSGK